MSEKNHLRIGVLAIQGAFAEHLEHLRCVGERLSAMEIVLEVTLVRQADQLHCLDGLILPGGESTTVSRFLNRNHLLEPLVQYKNSRRALWGTCAGMILLSDEVLHTKQLGQSIIGGLAISTERNAYGRQKESFEGEIELKDPMRKPGVGCSLLPPERENAIFIRAPGIEAIRDPHIVETLAVLASTQQPVAVRQGHLMATSFHPELVPDSLHWHEYFVNLVRQQSSRLQ